MLPAMAAEAERGVAVVTGGGSGIGREVARELARRGHPLALLGRRPEALAETLAEVGAAEGLALPCDVRNPAAVAAAAAEIERRFGAAQVLVPAAGVARIQPLEATAPEDFAAVVETNLSGVFHVLHAFLPAMRQRGRGWIFPLLSVAARKGFPGWSAYCASKWGLAGLVASLREELAGSGIKLTALYPGATDTPIWDGAPGSWNRAAMVRPEEVARAVAWTLDADPGTLVEEIHQGPAGGAL